MSNRWACCFAGTGAALLPTGEVPFIREIPALLRFDRLNAAALRGQHAAGAITIVGINERQATPVALQAAIAVNKCLFAHAEIGCNGCYVLIRQADVSFPAAAGSAALTGVDDGGVIAHVKMGVSSEFPRACALLPLYEEGAHRWVLPVWPRVLPGRQC